MRPATYALCCAAGAALTLAACALAVSAAGAAARALAYRACATEAALARLSPEHCATRPAPEITSALAY